MSDIIRLDKSMIRLLEELRENEIKRCKLLSNVTEDSLKSHEAYYKKKMELTKEKDYKELLIDALYYAITSFE